MSDNITEGWEVKSMRESSDLKKERYLPKNTVGVEDFYLVQESHECNGWSNRMYRDGNLSLTLYSGIPWTAEALIGFKHISPEIIRVVQLQARNGVKRSSLPKKWERVLLQTAINYAKENGYSQIQVQTAQNNYWREKYDEEHNLRLKMRYDVTAKRSGFTLDEEVDAWVLDLQTTENL